jgi:hypothetical protein
MIKLFLSKIFNKLGYQISKNYLRGFNHFLKKTNTKNLIGAEIGVLKGENELVMLKNLSIKKLYLIDPYNYEIPDGTFENDDLLSYEKEAKKKLKKFRDKTIWIRKKSSEAVKEMPELDFVYIDGSHAYEIVKQDIENYYRKVKKGGFVGGHDIENYINPQMGVVQAVTEFAVKNKIKLYIGQQDWWFIKNKD